MKKIILLILGCSLIFSACKKDTSNTQLTTNLTINFTQTVDGVDLITNTMIGWAFGINYDVQTLKYLISNITLHADDGNTLLLDEVHFIDISDVSTFSFIYQDVPNNRYTSISFDMGLDSTKNISNFYVNEDFHSTMFWPEPMGGGYHYMKLEGAYTNNPPSSASTFYNTHTGGTMGADYSFYNHLPQSITTIGDPPNSLININDEVGDVSIDINMEINNWYQTPNDITFSSYWFIDMAGDTISGIMGNMQKQMQLQANGRVDVFSVTASQ